jgi:replicative DNA helicase
MINYELELLNTMSNRNNFNLLQSNIKEYGLTEHTEKMIASLDAYFKYNTSTPDIDWDDYSHFYSKIYKPKADATELSLLETLIEKIKATHVTHGADALVSHFTKMAGIAEVYDVVNKIIDGDLTVQVDDICNKADALREKLDSLAGKDSDDMFLSTNVLAIKAYSSLGDGLDWGLPALDKSVGPLRPTNFVIVAARPEVGKTAFFISVLGHMVEQLPDEPNRIIIFNNEEDGKSIQARFISRVLGTPWSKLDKVAASKVENSYEAIAGHKDIFQVVDRDTLHTALIEKVVRDNKPAVVVINQMDAVIGVGDKLSEPAKLKALYNWGRRLAKKYNCIVIAVSQADASAEGEKFLTLAQLDGSKTGKPGEADLVIMVGKDPAIDDKRYISVPKNKLPGGPKSDESKRHSFHEVSFDGTLSKYT